MAAKNVRFVVPAAHAPLQKEEEQDVKEPAVDEVLIEVKACGVCHGDNVCAHGHWPGITFPRTPGHEIAGIVVKVGSGARAAVWSPGDRVGVGWHGGHCFTCDACRRGDFVVCKNGAKVMGIHFDGGYQKFCVAPAEALAKLPEGMPFIDAAPLMCAGVTVFNALRCNPKAPGSVVAVQGIGGLGHLALQYASKMGYVVAAVSRGVEKKERALALGAHHYIDSKAEDPAAALQALGGADIVLATGWDAKAMTALLPGLGRNGVLIVVGAAMEKMEVSGIMLLGSRSSIRGHPSGSSIDSQDAMEFAARHNIRPDTVVFPFSKTPEAFEAMNAGQFRVVLDFEQE